MKTLMVHSLFTENLFLHALKISFQCLENLFTFILVLIKTMYNGMHLLTAQTKLHDLKLFLRAVLLKKLCCPSKNLGLWFAKYFGEVTSLGYHSSHSPLLLIYHLWLLTSSRELSKYSHTNAKHTRIILYTSDHASFLKKKKKSPLLWTV